MKTRERISYERADKNVVACYYKRLLICKDDYFNHRMANLLYQLFWGERTAKKNFPFILYVTQDDGVKGFVVWLEEIVSIDFSQIKHGNLKRIRIIAKISNYKYAYADISINLSNADDCEDPMTITFYPCQLSATGKPILPIDKDGYVNFLHAIRITLTDESPRIVTKDSLSDSLKVVVEDEFEIDEHVAQFFLDRMLRLGIVEMAESDATGSAPYKAIMTVETFAEIFGIDLSDTVFAVTDHS